MQIGELMMTTAELSERLPEIQEIRVAIDAALKDGMIVPLDSEKGVFTSRIHLLDELSIQALSQEHLKSTKVVSFTRPAQYAPAALEVVEKDALVLMNAPSGVAGIRDLTAQLAGIAGANGRDVQVLASSAERAISLAKSDDLRERIISRQHVLSGDFHLKPQSTLIIEGAERLGLKETLVLLGEARAQDAQLVFLDSAGRQANGNAMSVLESAGVARSRRTEPAPGLEAEVVSIPNKRDRYEALANRFAELSGGSENVTAVVVGRREQAQLTGLVREALQNAGQLGRDGVEIEARQPVWLDSKTRRMPGSYRPGMVLEDRTDAKARKSYVIDRVHEDTRVLSLIDGDGVRAQTIKSFIVEHDQVTAAGGKPDYKGQVFLIDESSMAGNQDTAALFQAIASGGGRAVSMGDIDQFESVDVGAPFKLMQERSPMDVAIMKQIVRQKDLQLRGAVHDIIDNRIDAALQRIETQPADRVARSASAALPESAIQETETPVIDIVADWKDRTPEARSRTLIIGVGSG